MLILRPTRAKKHRGTRKPLAVVRDPHRTPPAAEPSFKVVSSRRYHVQSKHGGNLLQPVKNATSEAVQETGEHTHTHTCILQYYAACLVWITVQEQEVGFQITRDGKDNTNLSSLVQRLYNGPYLPTKHQRLYLKQKVQL